MNDFLAQYFTELSQLFSNSQQRLYWGYILCALAISYLWSIKNLCVWRRQNVINALGIKHFFSRSAFADYKIILINKALFLLFVPLLITKLSIATSVFELLHYSVSQPSSLENVLPTSIVIALFTLFLFLLDDFARFYFHKKMHDIAWLWPFIKHITVRRR
jgi:sterol desaturase/sphingolipid hydroxylase (fatty acid hydroxylase superfamily)